MTFLGGIQGGDLSGRVVPRSGGELVQVIVTLLKPFQVRAAVRSAAKEREMGLYVASGLGVRLFRRSFDGGYVALAGVRGWVRSLQWVRLNRCSEEQG